MTEMQVTEALYEPMYMKESQRNSTHVANSHPCFLHQDMFPPNIPILASTNAQNWLVSSILGAAPGYVISDRLRLPSFTFAASTWPSPASGLEPDSRSLPDSA